MGNRRFEMHDYRHIISRMRLGESDRQIAKAGLMGRNKAAGLREIAEKHEWLNPLSPLPRDEDISKILLNKPSLPSQPSSVDPFTNEVKNWFEQGISGTVIHRTLFEKYGYEGSYSSVRRHIQNLKKPQPPEATTMLDHEPGDTAQVDFGSGPVIIDVLTGEVLKTWFFVMTLAFSRYQYLEIVRDEKLLTWLGCHRRAFEFFGKESLNQEVISHRSL